MKNPDSGKNEILFEIHQEVCYDETRLSERPSYLSSISNELAGNIMYVVHSLLDISPFDSGSSEVSAALEDVVRTGHE